ncbi:MAG: XRE family transcriptional regulator [Lysobacteraceae bacterium]|nr:MAG: XRE family transcriptional regulator [Xanthomonadaceae bacterium]
MFGEALRLVRSFHEVNQSDLAEALGISRSYLSEVESGKKTPSLDLLQRYAEHFDIPLSSLVLFSEHAGESEKDLKVKAMLGQKAVAILRWIEKKAELKRAA